jgi:hypothetical protein
MNVKGTKKMGTKILRKEEVVTGYESTQLAPVSCLIDKIEFVSPCQLWWVGLSGKTDRELLLDSDFGKAWDSIVEDDD